MYIHIYIYIYVSQAITCACKRSMSTSQRHRSMSQRLYLRHTCSRARLGCAARWALGARFGRAAHLEPAARGHIAYPREASYKNQIAN